MLEEPITVKSKIFPKIAQNIKPKDIKNDINPKTSEIYKGAAENDINPLINSL